MIVINIDARKCSLDKEKKKITSTLSCPRRPPTGAVRGQAECEASDLGPR